MIVQESARGMTQSYRERESANDTRHADNKMTGSRPGTSIDQTSSEAQHISAKYTRYLKAVHWGSRLQ